MTTTSGSAELPPMERQRSFWDWHWDHWVQRKVINDWTLRRADEILGVVGGLGLVEPQIIDLGCGRGWFSERLQRFGAVTGIDLSERAIAAARVEHPGITFIAGDVYRHPLPQEHFDLAISQEVIAHVEDQAAYVSRAADVLKRGGYLIVTTGNRFVMRRMVGWPVQPPDHIARELNVRRLVRLLRPRFTVIRTKTFLPLGQLGILRVTNSPRLNRWLGSVIPPRYLDAAKERMGLGYQLLALARKER